MVFVTPAEAAALSTSPATLLHAIVNPIAGSGRAARRWPAFASQLSTWGYDVEAHFTTAPGHATALARDLALAGARTVLCVGGDGTVNEVVNGLIDGDRAVNPQTTLAVVPCGTGKDLGRTLGTRSLELTIEALRAGTTATIDIGRVRYHDVTTGELRSRYFANVADTGLGAATAQRINHSSKRLGGYVSYLKGAIATVAEFKPWQVEIEVDGAPLYEGTAGMVVFANGRYFAGGMLVAPDASICDGRLDIFILEGVGKHTLLGSLLPRVYAGRHVGQRGVRYLCGSRAVVRAGADMLVEMDGEQVGCAPLEVAVVPGVLRVVGLRGALATAGGCTNNNR